MPNNQPPSTKLPADEVLRAYSPRPAVRRLNRVAIAIAFLIIALLFAGRTILGLFSRYAAQIADREREQTKLRASAEQAERGVIDKLPRDYSFAIPSPAPTKPEPPPTPEEPKPTAMDPALLKELEALRHEQQAAIDSPIEFTNSHQSNGDEPLQTESPVHSDQPNGGVALAGNSGTSELRYDAQQREFFRDATGVQTYVRSRLLPPRSAYEIKAGTIIPAALVTPINSDLPGDVIAQVTTNLFDSISGEFLLVPQGSRLIGRYNSEVHKGQDRALIAWQRLILPNGYSIVLEAMPGTDAQGVAGLGDQVDWHAQRLASATFLSTLVALGGNYAANINPKEKELSIVGETVSQDAARIGQRVIDRELDLKPTILVRGGTPFNVLVNKDLELIPYVTVSNRR